MTEVFKTNVSTEEQANLLVDQIHHSFIGYRANFDLDDCDRILRVENISGSIESSQMISFLGSFGYTAQVLNDDDPPSNPDNEKLNANQFIRIHN